MKLQVALITVPVMCFVTTQIRGERRQRLSRAQSEAVRESGIVKRAQKHRDQPNADGTDDADADNHADKGSHRGSEGGVHEDDESSLLSQRGESTSDSNGSDPSIQRVASE